MANAKPQPTGKETREVDRKRLANGQTNWSASGDLPILVAQEVGLVPLKAIHQIGYGQQRVAIPGSLFVPVSATERLELLAGEFPAAEEASTAELALFAQSNEQQSEFA